MERQVRHALKQAAGQAQVINVWAPGRWACTRARQRGALDGLGLSPIHCTPSAHPAASPRPSSPQPPWCRATCAAGVTGHEGGRAAAGARELPRPRAIPFDQESSPQERLYSPGPHPRHAAALPPPPPPHSRSTSSEIQSSSCRAFRGSIERQAHSEAALTGRLSHTRRIGGMRIHGR